MTREISAALGDRYRVDGEIGAGGMATVYLAEDLRHQRKVAIKVLRPELSAAVGADRFLREITTTANLRHPHILPLYDSGAGNGILYYVMPYVEGESLRARMDRESQLPMEDALRIADEIADALHYAHGRGVVHRDIKPENILLENGRAVVADFGIAWAVNSAGDRLTQTGLSVGTPLYMSPEQASGGAVDGRSDLYALGCLLYEMLAGTPPFTGPNAMALRHRDVRASQRRLCRWRRVRLPRLGHGRQRGDAGHRDCAGHRGSARPLAH
jgi:eukaryotic-like serine/threonine-protein kinase